MLRQVEPINGCMNVKCTHALDKQVHKRPNNSQVIKLLEILNVVFDVNGRYIHELANPGHRADWMFSMPRTDISPATSIDR